MSVPHMPHVGCGARSATPSAQRCRLLDQAQWDLHTPPSRTRRRRASCQFDAASPSKYMHGVPTPLGIASPEPQCLYPGPWPGWDAILSASCGSSPACCSSVDGGVRASEACPPAHACICADARFPNRPSWPGARSVGGVSPSQTPWPTWGLRTWQGSDPRAAQVSVSR